MFFVIDTDISRSPQCENRIWQHLWELRDAMPVSVVLPTIVASPCPLLAEENADTVLSSTGMQVPHNSAWIQMQVDVSHFAQANGDIRLGALEKALDDCVERGEALHDSSGWSSAAVRYDSWLNRRLAVALRGWGNLVRLRGDDPGAFHTLSELVDLADFVTDALHARSQAMAREKGYCPALDRAGKHILASGSEMHSRWRQAIGQSALRHRNLTTMSAWDVFPEGQPADLRYVDLLPLLRSANCLSFRRDVDIGHWNLYEFRRFYERVSAILKCSLDAGQIAKQV